MNDVAAVRRLDAASAISPAKFAHFVLRTGQLDRLAEEGIELVRLPAEPAESVEVGWREGGVDELRSPPPPTAQQQQKRSIHVLHKPVNFTCSLHLEPFCRGPCRNLRNGPSKRQH